MHTDILSSIECGVSHCPQASVDNYLIALSISLLNSIGTIERCLEPLMPCVPVLDPLGAASWHLSPFLQCGLAVQPSTAPQRSVGFIRVSP